ncbi:MAG TPA: AarF/ABC1/UbiB kinase family protein [Polyangiales bacterium]|nr:AarF/ABC1/UbiB kinase family protein [Polyangiales bacterium]
MPTGKLARLRSLARVGMRSGLSALTGGDNLGAARQAAELLGNLRGLAAKAGQMASYVDGLVPDSQREVYERVLSSLQSATAHSPFARIRERIEGELEAPLSQLFAEFDEEPMASASIGQVHRARLHDGLEVAVKVQHPGIEAAIESDLSSADSAAGFAALLGPKAMNTKDVFAEIAARLREELDYQLEAQRQTLFARLHADDPKIHVPRIIETHSRRRVMTSELVRGLDLNAAVATSSAERKAYAETLWRFVFKSLLTHGAFNADPHPGNYLFHPNGRVSFLDFGCVQLMEPRYVEASREMHLGAIECDRARFERAAAISCQTMPGPYETDLLAYLWRCFEPLTRSPFRFERAYVSSVVRGVQDLKRHMFRKDSGLTPVPTGLVMVNRLQFGFYSVLARFDVDVDYAALDREILGRPVALAV